MPDWTDSPADYRHTEVEYILAAVRAGECVSVVGLSGAGKSNLAAFVAQRAGPEATVLKIKRQIASRKGSIVFDHEEWHSEK